MGHVGPLGNNLNFLFILQLSYSKPFHNILNYTSTANIEEVMKFCNLGDKTFEKDFSRHGLPNTLACLCIISQEQ